MFDLGYLFREQAGLLQRSLNDQERKRQKIEDNNQGNEQPEVALSANEQLDRSLKLLKQLGMDIVNAQKQMATDIIQNQEVSTTSVMGRLSNILEEINKLQIDMNNPQGGICKPLGHFSSLPGSAYGSVPTSPAHGVHSIDNISLASSAVSLAVSRFPSAEISYEMIDPNNVANPSPEEGYQTGITGEDAYKS